MFTSLGTSQVYNRKIFKNIFSDLHNFIFYFYSICREIIDVSLKYILSDKILT